MMLSLFTSSSNSNNQTTSFPFCWGGSCSIDAVKSTLYLVGNKESEDDDVTVGTAASDLSFHIQDYQASLVTNIIIFQAHVRGMLARKRFRTVILKNMKRKSVESNLKSIGGLLKSKKQLWDQCKGNIRGGGGPHTVFSRIGFVNVLVTTKDKTIRFSTKAERIYKTFNTTELTTIPSKLSGIFNVQYDEHNFVDFEAFIEKSLLLHEDVLFEFFIILKKHLESVQKCLKEITGWLSESEQHLNFLKQSFDLQDLKMPDGSELHRAREVTKILKQYRMPIKLQMTGVFGLTEEQDHRGMLKLLKFVEHGLK